jgi:tetratricopeptide (TPR) repeat protein
MRIFVLLFFAVVLATAPAHAEASKHAPEVPLPPIPKLTPIEKVSPEAEAVQSLESRLDQLASTEVDGPLAEVDLKFLTADLDVAIVPAIAQRLGEVKDELDGNAASHLLDKARERGQDALDEWKKKNKKSKDKVDKKDEPQGDWLVFILSLDKRGDTWRHLAEIYAMIRMLTHVGKAPAVRELVTCYSHFGELVRIDLQRAIEKLGDKAIAALIEAKQHDAQKVRSWAQRQLEGLGRVTPGESVSTTDAEVLADVLRAFGRVRDVEATGVILSFANSDRVQLRIAAREAIGAIGEPAEWLLKDAYETMTGTRPPKPWDYRRLTREIFRLHDRARLAKVYDFVESGNKALAGKRYADATAAFDKALAHAPLFEGRAAMAPAYLGRADELIAEGKHDEAAVALRKALRLAPESKERPKIESRLLFLEGKALAEKGTPDRFVLKRALELDPDNKEAKALLDSLDEQAHDRISNRSRYVAAIVIGLLAIGAMILLYRRRPPKLEEKKAS